MIFEDLNKFHTSIKRILAIDKLNKEGQLKRPFNSEPIPEPHTPFSHSKFRPPSKWNPPGPLILEVMCFQNETALAQTNLSKPLRHNLKKAESAALHSLKNNRDIIIKKADKGSSVVIQNRSDYIKEGLRQLNDKNFYKEQPNNLTDFHKLLVQQQVDHMLNSKEIDRKCADFLVIENPRTANFYLLPKIHKGKIPPLGRPIVSANDCLTERISQFVDHFIQPLVPLQKSYVRDTGHFLWLLENLDIPNDSILCTLDVTSLYTNIPNSEGIQAVRQQLAKLRSPRLKPYK